MTTTFYICAGIGWLVTCGICYALGWTEGRKQGELDGLEQAAAEFRITEREEKGESK